MKPRWSIHALGVALLAAVVCLIFLREPGFGDDFTYWSFAFDLHEQGLKTWSQASFHDLRWPVWGVSWLLQAIFGPGMLSYYGVPIIYVAAGALLASTFGRLITGSVWVSWACAVAFLFHPLLDTVCYRPMPDLSEGIWGAAAVLVWWRLSQSADRRVSAGWTVLLGTIIYIIESNRITGVFIVPVLLLCTLVYSRRSMGWLIAAGAVAAGFYVAEAAFYHYLFGDWLHNLHANMSAKGQKGTESAAFITLPFRFFDTLAKGNPLAPIYCALAIIGGWAAWTQRSSLRAMTAYSDGDSLAGMPRSVPPLGRVVVIWFATLYLEYACAPQSLWPWRPLIRDADRFLCGLAIPFSVLAALGLFHLTTVPIIRQYRWSRRIGERPILAGLVTILALTAITSRGFFDAGSVPALRKYIGKRQPGTKVFTHHAMRAYAFLVHPAAARQLEWFSRSQILDSRPDVEALAQQAQEFWYIRKIVWLTTRKQLEKKNFEQQRPLASYFDHPEREWTMAQLLARGDTPDLIFYHRRTADTPPARVLTADSPELQGMIPPFPVDWHGGLKEQHVEKSWNVPENLRGQLCRLELEADSDKVQGLTVRLQFQNGKKSAEEYLLKPYLHPISGKEFFAFQFPPGADKCHIELKLAKNTKSVHFASFRALVEAPKE